VRVPGALPALRSVGPFLDALVSASELSPAAAAQRLRRTVAAVFGWRVGLVRAPSALAFGERVRLGDGEALVPVAPGAGALRLQGGPPEALRQVAMLCAHALAQARAHPIDAAGQPTAPARPRVLVADRDAAARQAVTRLLDPDHEVITADDGAAAAVLARSQRLDAVVLGSSLPGADGLASLVALRQERLGGEIPALVLSGRADEAVRVRALELGADFMAKPFSGPELLARLGRVMRQASSAQALRHEAHTDPLTRLPNRRALEARLGEEVTRAGRYHTGLACIMADLDGLKPINDRLGHAAGDQALQSLASVLQAELRESDFAARVGGDEFVLLLPHTSADEAMVLAGRIRSRLEEVQVAPGVPLHASFGVAALRAGDAGEALVQDADRALYAAKRAGRSSVRLALARRARA
jgi:two-component system cell cycle response regulator